MGGELSNIEGEKASKTHRKSIDKNNKDSARSTKENTPDQNVGHHKRNKKDSYLNKLDVNKKISFTDFEEKFQINSYLMNYFDYYEIQKIFPFLN